MDDSHGVVSILQDMFPAIDVITELKKNTNWQNKTRNRCAHARIRTHFRTNIHKHTHTHSFGLAQYTTHSHACLMDFVYSNNEDLQELIEHFLTLQDNQSNTTTGHEKGV